MLSFLFLTPSILSFHLSLAHVGVFWHDAPCVCFEGLCSFSEAVCACSSYLLFHDPPPAQNLSVLGGISPFNSHLFFWLVTQNTVIHMQISSGGPPTISTQTPLEDRRCSWNNPLKWMLVVKTSHTVWKEESRCKWKYMRKGKTKARKSHQPSTQKHLAACKLKQSLLNLEARHFFLGLTQFKLTPGERLFLDQDSQKAFLKHLWSDVRNDVKPLRLVLYKMKTGEV